MIPLGSLMRQVVVNDPRIGKPFAKNNVAFTLKSYPDFRDEFLSRQDLKLSVRPRGDATYSTVSKFFSSLRTSKDVEPGQRYTFPSHVRDTIILRSVDDNLVFKMSMCFGPNPLLEIQPFLWIPKEGVAHTLTVTVLPGSYSYAVTLYPLIFLEKITFRPEDLPQPPHGSLQQTVVWAIAPRSSKVQ